METTRYPSLPIQPTSFPLRLTTTKATLLVKSSKNLRFLDQFIAKLNDAIVVMETEPFDDAGPRIVSVNHAFDKAFGYGRWEVLGKTFECLLGAKTDRNTVSQIYRAMRERVSVTRRIFSYDKEGHEHWIEMDIFPVLDDQKGSGFIAAVQRPIVDTGEQEESSRLNGERFSQAFEYGPLGMALIAPDGHWLTANHRLCDLIGYKAGELQKTTFQRVTHPEDLSAELILAAKTLKGGLPFYEVEKRFIHRDGSIIWAHVTVSLVRDHDGNPLYFIKQVQNITESRLANEKIAQQAALLDKTNDAIVLCNMEGRILFWNKGAEAIYGWTAEEMNGRLIRESNPKDILAQYEEASRVTLDKGKWTGQSAVVHKDSREIVAQFHWSLIKDHAEQPKAFLIISHDITDRTKMEAQLMRAQRMESIGTLAGGIAHDLNNILTPIMISIEMLKQSSNNPRTTNIIDTIETITKRGADIVRQVLSFARGMKGDYVEVQPRHLLKDIQALIMETLPKNIQMKYFFPHESWTILGDPTQLHQILMNLCVNARDAMPDGGTLKIAAENAVVDEQYASMHLDAKPGKYIAISVSDTGTGIAPEILDKIFEPFFTTKEIGKGTGLGLSTVIAIVRSHQGFLNVSSEVGQGTTFKVYIPAIEESSGLAEQGQELNTLPRGNGETVLIVDDEASILTITGQTLEAFGYATLTATDGADAVAIYAQHRDKISVVLTDMSMPVMDGMAAIRVLSRINPAVKIIAASGLKTNSLSAQESCSEVKYIIDKPYTAGTLLKTLRAILDDD